MTSEFQVPTFTQPSTRNFAGPPAGVAMQINIGGKQKQIVNLNGFQIQQLDGTEIQVSCLLINSLNILIACIMTSMGQSPWDDIKIPGPQWDT